MLIIAKEHLICMQVQLIDVRLATFVLDGFSRTDRYGIDGLVQYIF